MRAPHKHIEMCVHLACDEPKAKGNACFDVGTLMYALRTPVCSEEDATLIYLVAVLGLGSALCGLRL